jgi:carbon starvation protein
MNSLTLVLIVIAWFSIGYFVYSKFLEKKLINPSNRNKTPSHNHKGVDYKPSKKEFLFGHHFASIAGAGPIIGPILAVSYFGWLFVVLWIAIGTFFIGAVHDYLSLMFSVRHDGKGIAKSSEKVIGRKTFFIFSILLWFTLMLIITVFSVSAAQSFVEVPALVIPFFGLTFIAILLGLGVYKWKGNRTILSVLALILAVFFVYLGISYPVNLPFSNDISQIIWIGLLFIYALVVSLLPVWIILQPRDYISSLGLFLFLGIGLLSIFIANPIIEAPARIYSEIPVWPILFITVACGAISGFHALVSSGTTSKQLDKESHGRFIGYGAMLAEGLVALLVVIFVSAGLKWGNVIAGDLNFFQNALSAGWIVAFGNGFANIVNSAFPFIRISILVALGALIVNLFILTSLDTSTRVGRMIASEMLKSKSKLNNKALLTLLILIPAFLLAITNSYATLWRLFGASNQLIASVILLIISAYLIEKKKPSVYTLIPGLFMIVTTLYALVYQIFNKSGYLVEKNIPLIVISGLLILFALIVFIEALRDILKKKKFLTHRW